MELSSFKNKNFQEVTFRARKIKIRTLKKCLIFREMEPFSSKIKKVFLAKPEKQKFLLLIFTFFVC